MSEDQTVAPARNFPDESDLSAVQSTMKKTAGFFESESSKCAS
jgi:hypothetical protein